ncbi:hypothetical protein [Saliphagus infecundisoli]|uniref:Tat (Twin-arginine translocation) pathway signal sequence n=1 Tax=Saliphagus infecundisoli TaxID=1849069 RepID=A0ABD5QGB7_9EURY|nr:hypothetical protein [Saliphagus infecundisoli]
MTDRKRLTRRDSLKGIAAAGTVIGGATLGLSTAMAHEEGDGKESDEHGNETGEDGNNDGKGGKTDDGKDRDGKDGRKKDEKRGKKDAGKGENEKEYDESDGRDDNGKHDDKKGGKKSDGKKDDEKDGKHDEKDDHGKDGKKDDHEKKDDGKHDGKDGTYDDEKDDHGKDPAKRIDLAPVCYESGGKKGNEKYGTFRVENHGKQDVKVGWKRHCDGKRDYMAVAAGKKECFQVGLGNSGTATVSLYYDGKKIATADAETDIGCDCKD